MSFVNPLGAWVRQPSSDWFYIPEPDNVFYNPTTGEQVQPGTYSPPYSNGSSGSSSSSGPPPRRYLRLMQRDDGLGIHRHPRLAGTGTNTPSSAQTTRSARLGTTNTYR